MLERGVEYRIANEARMSPRRDGEQEIAVGLNQLLPEMPGGAGAPIKIELREAQQEKRRQGRACHLKPSSTKAQKYRRCSHR